VSGWGSANMCSKNGEAAARMHLWAQNLTPSLDSKTTSDAWEWVSVRETVMITEKARGTAWYAVTTLKVSKQEVLVS